MINNNKPRKVDFFNQEIGEITKKDPQKTVFHSQHLNSYFVGRNVSSPRDFILVKLDVIVDLFRNEMKNLEQVCKNDQKNRVFYVQTMYLNVCDINKKIESHNNKLTKSLLYLFVKFITGGKFNKEIAKLEAPADEKLKDLIGEKDLAKIKLLQVLKELESTFKLLPSNDRQGKVNVANQINQINKKLQELR